MADETGYNEGPPAQEAGAERGISSVASSGDNKSKVALGLLFVAVVLALIFIVLGSGGDNEAPVKQEETQEFVSSNTNDAPERPQLQPREPPPLPRATAQPTTAPTVDKGPSDAELRAEARRRSPILVFNQDNGGSGQSQSAGDSRRDALAQRKAALQEQLDNLQTGQSPGGVNVFGGGGGSGQSGENEGFAQRNDAFADNSADETVKTVSARQLSDLSYRINQGKLIRGVLETAIQSDLPGLLRSVVAEDVYSANGDKLLIPRGSRLIGEYRSGLVRGQTRVFVVWNRLIDPSGIDVALGSRGTDLLGRAGLTGVIDTHFFKRFGGALLLSLIGSSVQAAQGDNTVVLNTSESFSDAAEVALENSINIPPTIHVDQGAPIQVFVARDLDFGPVLAGRR